MSDVCMNPLEARRLLQIGTIAYETLCNLVFVRIPNERGRWVLTHKCVALQDCPTCVAVAGEPCFNGSRARPRYLAGTHYYRHHGSKGTPKPKLRVRAEDLEAALAVLD